MLNTLRRPLDVARDDYRPAAARAYAEDVNFKGGPDQESTRAYLRAIPADLSGKRILDVGCGEGKLPNEELCRRRPEAVVGIDISDEFLAQARREAPPQATYLNADMHHLPASLKSSQDLVVSRFSLHYSQDLPGLMTELASALVPGGHLIFLTNMARGRDGQPLPPQVQEDRWIPIVLSERVRVNNLAYSEDDYQRALEQAGFDMSTLQLQRFGANHKVARDYPYRDRLDLNAVIVDVQKPERQLESVQGSARQPS